MKLLFFVLRFADASQISFILAVIWFPWQGKTGAIAFSNDILREFRQHLNRARAETLTIHAIRVVGFHYSD